MQTNDFKKYIVSFFITLAIFTTAFFASEYFNKKKIAEIRNIEDTISIDILSSETQFDLLKESPCTQVSDSVLSQELNDLAGRLDFMEQNRSTNDTELLRLKKYYSLLQVKDYILMKKLGEQCKLKPVSVIYLYSNSGDCTDCKKEGNVLTYLREQYPDLRIYSFDYNLDLSALKTLIFINKVKKELPAIVVDGKVHYGFQDLEAMQKIIPNLETLRATTTATSTATTTKKK